MSTQGVEFQSLNVTVAGNRQLLHDITLRIAPGTTTALLGRSGSGKTTLLRTVNALVRPTTGRVLVGDQDVATLDPTEPATIALRRSIGYVIQETGLFPRMTIARNIGLSLELAAKPHPAIKERAAEMLQLVGLPTDVLSRYPWQLSGGQRQRVGLARALANEPNILLMDEPFGALDPLTRAEMQTMLRDLLHRVNKTTLIITHDLEEALYLADRIVLLEDGRIVADLLSTQVRTSPNPAIRTYVAATHRDLGLTPHAQNKRENWWEIS